MPRFRPLGPRDTVSTDGGDIVFRGVYEKGGEEKIPVGFVRRAVNVTFEDGDARTRLGSMTPGSLQLPDGPEPLFGSGVFSDPIGAEWLLLATASGVWRVAEGATPRKVTIPEMITGRVTFAQAFRTILCFRGSNSIPWSWDGDPRHAFEPISKTSEDGTAPIPNGPDRPGLRPVVVDNRLVVPHGRSQLAVSDIFAYDRYDPIFADFNVTGGNDDTLTGLYRYPGGILIFNTQSIQRLAGVEPTLTQLRLDEPINDSIGCVAGGTIARVGNDVLFLSESGIYPLREVEQRRETAPVPLSEPLEKTMLRINWRAASAAVAEVLGKFYYLAVPLDGADGNNAILPFNSALEAWEGVHTFPAGVQIDALHRLDFLGRKRLHAVDYASGRVHLLYEGRADGIGAMRNHIPMSMTSRAYLLESAGRKRFRRGRVYLRTWAPRFGATMETDGVNESIVLASAQTKDRTRPMVFGQKAYDETNACDDHGRAYREDYSVDLDTPADPGANGIDPELEQHHVLPFVCRSRGRYASITVTNDRGTLAVTTLTLEAQEADRNDRSGA